MRSPLSIFTSGLIIANIAGIAIPRVTALSLLLQAAFASVFIGMIAIACMRCMGRFNRYDSSTFNKLLPLVFSVAFLISSIAISSIAVALSIQGIPISVDAYKDMATLSLTTGEAPVTTELHRAEMRNSQYNFALRFPDGWKVSEGTQPHIVWNATHGMSTIAVQIRAFPTNLGNVNSGQLEDMMNDLVASDPEGVPGLKIENSKIVIINDYPFIRTRYEGVLSHSGMDFDMVIEQLDTVRNETAISLTLGSTQDEFPLVAQEFEKTMSSFRFTDQAMSPTPSSAVPIDAANIVIPNIGMRFAYSADRYSVKKTIGDMPYLTLLELEPNRKDGSIDIRYVPTSFKADYGRWYTDFGGMLAEETTLETFCSHPLLEEPIIANCHVVQSPIPHVEMFMADKVTYAMDGEPSYGMAHKIAFFYTDNPSVPGVFVSMYLMGTDDGDVLEAFSRENMSAKLQRLGDGKISNEHLPAFEEFVASAEML